VGPAFDFGQQPVGGQLGELAARLLDLGGARRSDGEQGGGGAGGDPVGPFRRGQRDQIGTVVDGDRPGALVVQEL
jgi:hypothetical protein